MQNVEMVFHSLTSLTRCYHVIPLGKPDQPIGVIQRSGGDPQSSNFHRAGGRSSGHRWRFYPASGQGSRKDFDTPEEALAGRRLRLVGVLEAGQADAGREAPLPQVGDRELEELAGKFVALDQVFAELRALRTLVEEQRPGAVTHLPFQVPMSGERAGVEDLVGKIVTEIKRLEISHSGQTKPNAYWLLRDAAEALNAQSTRTLELVHLIRDLRGWVDLAEDLGRNNTAALERIDCVLVDYGQVEISEA